MLPELRPYEPSYYLLEEARKSWNHIISDKVVYAFDPGEVAGNTSSTVTEDYIKGDSWIELHLIFEGNRNRYAVILEAGDGKNGRGSLGEMKLCAIPTNGNSSMLIDIAHQVESPEKVLLNSGCIRSTMRLKRIDDMNGLNGHSASVLLESLLGFDIPPIQDRELRSLRIGAVDLGECPNQLIEGRSQAVKEIPEDKRKPVGGIRDINIKTVESIGRIIFTPKGVRFCFNESNDLRPQTIKVFLRPGCFQIGVSQSDSPHRS